MINLLYIFDDLRNIPKVTWLVTDCMSGYINVYKETELKDEQSNMNKDKQSKLRTIVLL